MNTGQLAALIAAGFFAAGVCAAIYVLARLARLISVATAMVTAHAGSADELIRRAQATVDRADEQLARTGAVAESVDQVAVSMSELSEQVSAVAGTTRLIAAGLGAPVLRLAAAGHGVRRAMAIRRAATQRHARVPLEPGRRQR
jgi:methyl-accepting chemotaxis protein